jgi:hypothetical protein
MSFLPSDFVPKMDNLNQEIIKIEANVRAALDTTNFHKNVGIVISSLSARLVKPGQRIDGEKVCLIHAGLRTMPWYASSRPYPIYVDGFVELKALQKATTDLLAIQQKVAATKQPPISTLITFLSDFNKCNQTLRDGNFIVNINTNNVEIDSNFNNVLIKQIKLSYTEWNHLCISCENDETQTISRGGFDLKEFIALYEEPVYTKLLATLKQIEQHTAQQAEGVAKARSKLLEAYSEYLITSLI